MSSFHEVRVMMPCRSVSDPECRGTSCEPEA